MARHSKKGFGWGKKIIVPWGHRANQCTRPFSKTLGDSPTNRGRKNWPVPKSGMETNCATKSANILLLFWPRLPNFAISTFPPPHTGWDVPFGLIQESGGAARQRMDELSFKRAIIGCQKKPIAAKKKNLCINGFQSISKNPFDIGERMVFSISRST